jgi:hypothetical protein
VPLSDERAEFESDLKTAVRVEALRLDARFEEALTAGSEAGIRPQEIIERTLARIRRRDAAKIGRLGERVARVRQRKRRIPSLSGTARFRIPDILTDDELIEVKNVSRLVLTAQLADFLAFAEASGTRFVLVTRFDTVLAPELAALVAAGRIEHRQFSGLLSPTGRRLIRGLVNEAIRSEPQPSAPQ